MGYKEVGRVLRHSKASGTAKLILVAIAHHDGPGGAWPSRGLLAEYANVDEKNARRAIKKLEEEGELRVHYGRGGSEDRPEGHRPNLYEILVHCPPECDGSEHHRMPKRALEVTRPKIPRPRGEGATSPPQAGGDSVQDEGATAPPKLSTQPPSATTPGSKDQDFESPPIFGEIPATAAEKADRRRLAQHMTRWGSKDVDTVWAWMRTGRTKVARTNTPMRRPGGYAAKYHRIITDTGETEWEGYFRRHFLNEDRRAAGVGPMAVSDPWAS